MSTVSAHAEEIDRGERFEFGKNWSRFLKVLNDNRIALAQKSLQDQLKVERLDGKTFLDIGSGSGLFSLAARRLGAKVRSFDYDPSSVACTQEVKRRYSPDDSDWVVEHGSVLEKEFLSSLGTYDIVYSWGVLHHSGQMWQALANVKPLVKMGGTLFIAIYNDLGSVTDNWAKVKQRYNRLPTPLALGYALTIIAEQEARSLVGHMRQRNPGGWLKGWTEYDKESARGMSKWHDWIDWIGGHPYERATIEELVDCYAGDGYRIECVVDRSHGYGCNELVFVREAELGVYIDSPIPGGTSLVRQYGRRVVNVTDSCGETCGTVALRNIQGDGERLWLFRSDTLVEPTEVDDYGSISLPFSESELTEKGEHCFVVPGQLREPKEKFAHARGFLWSWEMQDLSEVADSVEDGSRSTVFMLQNGCQLGKSHQIHDELAKVGNGGFSHWGGHVYFAPFGNINPNDAPENFKLFIPTIDAQS